jgi:F0F1-type ATP synthase assembly protein I
MADDDGGAASSAPGIMAFAGLGALSAFLLLAGLAVGFVVDRRLHTLPLFMMVGLVVGIGLSVVAVRTALRRR